MCDRVRDISTQNMMISFSVKWKEIRGGLTNTRFLLTRGCQFDSICYRETARFRISTRKYWRRMLSSSVGFPPLLKFSDISKCLFSFFFEIKCTLIYLYNIACVRLDDHIIAPTQILDVPVRKIVRAHHQSFFFISQFSPEKRGKKTNKNFDWRWDERKFKSRLHLQW